MVSSFPYLLSSFDELVKFLLSSLAICRNHSRFYGEVYALTYPSG